MISGQPALDGVEPGFEVSDPFHSGNVPSLAAKHRRYTLQFKNLLFCPPMRTGRVHNTSMGTHRVDADGFAFADSIGDSGGDDAGTTSSLVAHHLCPS